MARQNWPRPRARTGWQSARPVQNEPVRCGGRQACELEVGPEAPRKGLHGSKMESDRELGWEASPKRDLAPIFRRGRSLRFLAPGAELEFRRSLARDGRRGLRDARSEET